MDSDGLNGGGLSEAARSWFAARWRRGNWFAVAADEPLPEYLGFSGTVLAEAFKLWFTPEIKHRLLEGSLPTGASLVAMQVLFPPGQSPNIVRTNEEVRGQASLNTEHEPFVVGQRVPFRIAEINRFDLSPGDIHCGHFSLFFENPSGWRAFFDFTQARPTIKLLLNKSKQFLDTASYAFDRQYYDAAVDNLFSACELYSSARVMLDMHLTEELKSHGFVHSKVNDMGRLGNISRDFVKLFNRLSGARRAARYKPSCQDANITKDDMERFSVELESVRQRINPLESSGC